MWTHPDRPFQDLPPLPPPDVETPRVLKAVIGASRQLSALDMACRRLPDPSILINSIPLLEAQASSEIENIVTTNDELFRAAHDALDEPITPQIKEALSYREALRTGFTSLQNRPITTRTAVDVCSCLQAAPMRIRDQPGTYIGNPVTGERIYTPPDGRDTITSHLSSWERFIHGDHRIDPLAVMALQHYQFEAIHPFNDGNGRTGRVLNLLYLIEQGLLEWPVLYLSGHIVRHKEGYYAALRGVTQRDDWESWIIYMVAAVEHTATWTLNLIDAISALRAETEQRIRENRPKLRSAELTRLIFTQPYVRIADIETAGIAVRQTASGWLHQLADDGLLKQIRVGRSVIFVNTALLELLLHSTPPQ